MTKEENISTPEEGELVVVTVKSVGTSPSQIVIVNGDIVGLAGGALIVNVNEVGRLVQLPTTSSTK